MNLLPENQFYRMVDEAGRILRQHGFVMFDCGAKAEEKMRLSIEGKAAVFEPWGIPKETTTLPAAPPSEENPPDLDFFELMPKADQLLKAARKSGRNAAILAIFVKELVDGLNGLARDNPALMKNAVQTSTRWPIMYSTAPGFRDDPAFLDALGLGAKTGIDLRRTSKLNPRSLAYGIAIFLREEIEGQSKGALVNGKKSACWTCHGSKIKLRAFNLKTAPDWWTVAKNLFLLHCPEPEKVPELRALVKTPSRLRSPGRTRQAILDLIRGQFFALAACEGKKYQP